MSSDPDNQSHISASDLDTFHRTHEFTLPAIGDVLIGPLTKTRYTVGRHLDAGSFGVVFECVDEWGHSLVAKIIKPLGDREDTEAKAFSEVTAMALVRSPNIVHVHDAFIHRGACYIISERCAVTLRVMLETRPEMRHIYFFPMAKAVLHALHTVHNQGFAHCDVHAGNVFFRLIADTITSDGKSSIFKLGDFGLTRPISNMDPSGTFLMALRPPETFDPEEFGPLDHRSDLYQAGLLFLSVLHGKEIIWNEHEIIAGKPREFAEAIGSPVGDFVATMLRRHVDARPASALIAWREFDAAHKLSCQ